MKLILEIPDNKTKKILEILSEYKFVKTKELTDYKSEIFEDIREAVEEMKLVKTGKKQTKLAIDFINEL